MANLNLIIDEQFCKAFPNRLTDNQMFSFRDATKSLLECALWSSGEEFDDYSIFSIDGDCVEKIVKSFFTFIKENIDLCMEFINIHSYNQLGHSYWLSSNGHGAGFFDWNGDLYEKLHNAAKYNVIELYVGDDNKIYCL